MSAAQPAAGSAVLRQFVRVDLLFTATSAVAVALLSQVLPASPAYPLVVALPALAALLMWRALRLVEAGDVVAAVGWMSWANWGIAIPVAAVVTFLWPLMLLVAVLPCVLAASFLEGRQVRTWLLVSLVVAVATVLLGELQDVTGFSADAPQLARQLLLVVVTPLIAILIGVLSWSGHRRLQAALSVAVAQQAELRAQAEQLRASRARVVAAADRARRRIERDLHDGAQQRLVAVRLHLARVARECGEGAAGATLALAREEAAAAHRELRELAQGLYPPVLAEHGLAAALSGAADRSGVPVRVDLQPTLCRMPAEVEAAVYFCGVEALQNAVKHAAASVVTLAAGCADGAVWFTVTDDGVGFDPSLAGGGQGLQNLHDRLGAVGGTVRVVSAPGEGTSVRGRIPLQTTARPGEEPGRAMGVSG